MPAVTAAMNCIAAMVMAIIAMVMTMIVVRGALPTIRRYYF
jgi:hypothetical protein